MTNPTTLSDCQATRVRGKWLPFRFITCPIQTRMLLYDAGELPEHLTRLHILVHKLIDLLSLDRISKI